METLDGREQVAAGEAVRFESGEYHGARNEHDAPVTLFAIGAPRDSEAVRIPLDCPDCGWTGLRPGVSEEKPALGCPECFGESDATCPTCGSDAMYATVPASHDHPKGFCQDCESIAD